MAKQVDIPVDDSGFYLRLSEFPTAIGRTLRMSFGQKHVDDDGVPRDIPVTELFVRPEYLKTVEKAVRRLRRERFG